MHSNQMNILKQIKEWFYGRAGDHIPNEHYQRLKTELEEICDEAEKIFPLPPEAFDNYRAGWKQNRIDNLMTEISKARR